MNKKQLSERDICTKFITPALKQAGWDITTQVREEFSLTKGRIIVVDAERTDGFTKFVGDGQKVTFAKEVVPTLDAGCFEVFRPMFEFIKSKCSASEEPTGSEV